MLDQVISIKSNERVVICGKTGSGKSVLMRKYCRMYARVIFIDPKHENGDLPYTFQAHDHKKVIEEVAKNQDIFFILYQPIQFKDEDFNELCAQLFKYKDMTIFLDEILLKPVDWHRTLIRMGRRKGIGMWHIFQRPHFVDNFVLSEAEHYFVFKLLLKSDKDKIAGVIGEEIIPELENLEQYQFVYYKPQKGIMRFKPLEI